jgi:predicted transcriptional regulator
MTQLRSRREALGMSQSKLARISRVSRFKICMFELGGGSLNPLERQRIKAAIEAESARLCEVTANMDIRDLEVLESN